MKYDSVEHPLDEIDLQILHLLQDNCKQPLAALGQQVGLTASSVMERIHKLEEAGVITGYSARVDPRRLGRSVAAFIAVQIGHPRAIVLFEEQIAGEGDVLECHHVTGSPSLMLKVRTDDTESLEDLIDRMRSIEGVTRTETMVVLSTHTERQRIRVTPPAHGAGEFLRRPRRSQGARLRRAEGSA